MPETPSKIAGDFIRATGAAREATGSGRSATLDIIRAFAMLAVIGRHLPAHIGFAEGAIGWVSRVLGAYGRFGVPLFFTLSGYLVGGIIISEYLKRGNFDVGRFLIRRGLKIYPAYYVFLAYVFTMPVVQGVKSLGQQTADFWPNLIFLQNYFGPQPAPHTWSLAVEEHFYLLLPAVLFLLFRTGRQRWIAPACLAAPLAWTLGRVAGVMLGDPYVLHPLGMGATHLCVDGLLVGVGLRAAAHYHANRFQAAAAWRWPILAVGLGFLAVYRMHLPSFAGVNVGYLLPLSQLAALAIVYSLLHMRWPQLVARPLAWAGRYSYSVYLWHLTAMDICVRALMPRLPIHDVNLRWVVMSTTVVAACIVAGVVFAKLVEYPVLRWRNRVFPSRA